jgi:hypothetical protein
MEIVITLEREPGASTVGIYSEDPAIYVIRDATVSDTDLLAAFACALADLRSEVAPQSDYIRRSRTRFHRLGVTMRGRHRKAA